MAALGEADLARFALAVPKTELHLHLDGSLTDEFIRAGCVRRKLEVPADVRLHLHGLKQAQVLSQGFDQKKNSNWPVFDYCNQFLQTAQELTEATIALFQCLDAHNVFYAEVRFCPSLHTQEGLTEEEALVAVIAGVREGLARTRVEAGGVIVGALRSKAAPEDPDHSMRMVRLAHKHFGQGVVGFDVCGDEGNFSLSLHEEALDYAQREGINLAVHAGEWPTTTYDQAGGSLENIRLLLRKGVKRIGHGIVLDRDDQLLAEIAEKRVVVECCVTGNIGWKVPSYDVHPIKKMVRAGARASLNSDNIALSGEYARAANPTNEVHSTLSKVGLTIPEIRQVLLNGAAGGFNMSEDLLARYESRLRETFTEFGLAWD